MVKKLLLVIVFLVIVIATAYAYTIPDNHNINMILENSYSAQDLHSVNLVLKDRPYDTTPPAPSEIINGNYTLKFSGVKMSGVNIGG